MALAVASVGSSSAALPHPMQDVQSTLYLVALTRENPSSESRLTDWLSYRYERVWPFQRPPKVVWNVLSRTKKHDTGVESKGLY